jgi:hypothetical protein
MTTDFKLRNGHRSRALLHAVSLINAQACKPLYERRSRLLSDIVHCAYQIGAIASERYKAFAEFSSAGLTEQTSELEIGALASHLLGYVEIAQTYRSVWGVWLDHCSRPGFLTFQVPEGAKNRQPMAGEILSFKRLSEGGQGERPLSFRSRRSHGRCRPKLPVSKHTSPASRNTCGFSKRRFARR